MKSLLKLFRAIETGDVKRVNDICNTFDCNEYINRRYEQYWIDGPHSEISDRYRKKRCLGIFYNTLLVRSERNIGLYPMIEIFEILHKNGIKWENTIIETLPYNHPGRTFINALFARGEIEFIIRILPLSKDMNGLWTNFSSYLISWEILLTAFINFIDTKITNQYVKDFISILTPEIKASLISSYIKFKRVYEHGFGDLSRTQINAIAVLSSCGEINWKCSVIAIMFSNYEAIYIYLSCVFPFRSDTHYTIWWLLISAGLCEGEIPERIKNMFKTFLLKENSRWLLTREILPIVSLPIPLESRINLWSKRRVILFDRYTISVLLQS